VPSSVAVNETQTLGEMFKRHYPLALVDFLAVLPPDYRLRFERDFFRLFDRWPDWTLRQVKGVKKVKGVKPLRFVP
jgi:hypothetical protein